MAIEVTRYVDDQVVDTVPVQNLSRGVILVGEDQELVCSELPNGKKGETEVFIWKYGSRQHPEGPDQSFEFVGLVGTAGSMTIPISESEGVIVQHT